MKKLPFSSLNLNDYPIDERLAVFQQMTSSVYHAEAVGNKQAFMIETFGYYVNQLMFHNFKCSNTRFSRHQEHIQGNDSDFLVLHAQLDGEELLHMEHGIIRLLPGNIYLRDWSYPFESQTISMHIRGILIPRDKK